MIILREKKKFVKRKGTKKQEERLRIINKFHDDIAKSFYEYKYKNKN